MSLLRRGDPGGGVSPTVGPELKGSWNALVAALTRQDGAGVLRGIEKVGELLDAAYEDDKVWRDFFAAHEQKRRLVQIEAARRQPEMTTLNPEQALQFQHQVAAIVAMVLQRHSVPRAAVDKLQRYFEQMAKGVGIDAEEIRPGLQLLDGGKD